MAVYKVNEARALLPVRYFEAGGALASHDTDENLLAVNSRGVPSETYQPVSKGAVFYTDAASADAAKEEAGEGAAVYFVANEAYVESHVKLGTFKEVEQQQRQAASEPQKQQQEAPKSRGRKAAGQEQNPKVTPAE